MYYKWRHLFTLLWESQSNYIHYKLWKNNWDKNVHIIVSKLQAELKIRAPCILNSESIPWDTTIHTYCNNIRNYIQKQVKHNFANIFKHWLAKKKNPNKPQRILKIWDLNTVSKQEDVSCHTVLDRCSSNVIFTLF